MHSASFKLQKDERLINCDTTPELRLSRLKAMMASREADRREDILFRQGRAQFHVSSSGHEAICALAAFIKDDDYLYCHYRDRALLLALEIPLYEAALGFFAKAASGSGGRQLVNHFSVKSANIVSAATPTGLQYLPAVGTAWAFKMQKRPAVSFCFTGEASARQGEFFEAMAFAIQENLPVIFVVEDNGYGISTPTGKLNPCNLGMIPQEILSKVDGRDVDKLAQHAEKIIDAVRKGEGPHVLWLSLDRLKAHTGSDDHSRYRSIQEITDMQARDPISLAKQSLIEDGVISEADFLEIEKVLKEEVKEIYQEAEQAENPEASDAQSEIFSHVYSEKRPLGFSESSGSWSMSCAWNETLHRLMQEKPNALIFGEDIEDGKGGVFGLTKDLSTQYPGRVINSPLAEATIAGLASGLAVSGFLPIFEIQFADFLGPAFNQIVNQIATLRWRSRGQYECPLIIYAPCGSYISNGGPWHSQTNESWFAHAPGLKVYMPSNANDAAQMLYNAAHGRDPVLILLPKNQFQASVKKEEWNSAALETAHITREGKHVTLIGWGNCAALCTEAADLLAWQGIDCEVIDIRSIAPCDWNTLHQSVKKTGRLVVVQEDNKTCSFGQAIISEICGNPETWNCLYTSPQLLSRPDVHIGFSAVLENAVLPQASDIVKEVRAMLGRAHD